MKKVSNKNKDYKSHLLLGAEFFCLLLCLKALSPRCCLTLAVEMALRRHGAVQPGQEEASTAALLAQCVPPGLGASMEK